MFYAVHVKMTSLLFDAYSGDATNLGDIFSFRLTILSTFFLMSMTPIQIINIRIWTIDCAINYKKINAIIIFILAILTKILNRSLIIIV